MSMIRRFNAAYWRVWWTLTRELGIWDYPRGIIIGTGGRLARIYEAMKCTFGRIFVHDFVQLES